MKKLKKKKSKKRKTTIPPVEISAVSDDHIPSNVDGVTYVYAYIDANFQGARTVSLSHRNTFNLNLGFTAKVPDGFELVFDLTPEFKDRGLEVYKNALRGEGGAYLSVRNLGREIAQIHHRQAVATARIVPVYELTIKVK